MIVETLAVGTELLLGQIVNTNASEIGARLAEAGLDQYRQVVVGDNLDRLVDAINDAVARSDAVIITGGIGPTQDDLTREAMCAAAGVGMVRDEAYAADLKAYWERRGREIPESNFKQADRPEGSETFPNPKGTAPGIRMRLGDAWVFALPGVPMEMLPMLSETVIPFLRAQAGETGVLVSRVLRSWGESESRVADIFSDMFEESVNPSMAFLASKAEIKIRLTAKASTEDEARALIAPVEEEVRRRMGTRIFGADDDTIDAVLFGLLDERGWTIGTAESATGGLIAARLTARPGSSKWFRGGIVAYHEALKEQLVGVDRAAIDAHSVVSEEVAVAMAEGAARRLGVDVVIAVTGLAGPGTALEYTEASMVSREVGTMIVAVRTPDGVRARTLMMPGDRERVRTYTTTAALHLARLAITGAAADSWWG